MNYRTHINKIFIKTKYFDPKSIFECGQVFSYVEIDGIYFAYPGNKLAAVYKENGNFVVECVVGDVDFFVDYFDLERDYSKIIGNIKKINKSQTDFDKFIIENSIKFGKGIRILKQEVVETIISFIFSANNNIKRFKKSLDSLRKDLGEEILYNSEKISEKIRPYLQNNKFYSFPSLEKMGEIDFEYLTKIGAGYRAPYLLETVKNLKSILSKDLNRLTTEQLIKEIVLLKGVGLKVAQCIVLFAFGRTDCFPVDTWVKQIYLDMNKTSVFKNQQQISKQLIGVFKLMSGYVQQYLYYYKRELKNVTKNY